MKLHRIGRLLRAIVTCAAIAGCASVPPAEETDVRWLCQHHAEIVTHLFDGLYLDRAGLKGVKAAVDRGDWPAACDELVAYYRACASGDWLRRPPRPGRRVAAGQRTEAAAGKESEGAVRKTSELSAGGSDSSIAVDGESERILADRFTFNSEEATVPRTNTGGLDWTYNGPRGARQWGWSLNSHVSLKQLAQGYFKTGNVRYVRRLDELIRDWVLTSPYPARKSATPQWRGLEVAIRVKQWDEIFYGLQDVDEFSPVARILMLSSLLDHAHYLRNFPNDVHGNWRSGEIEALAVVAVSWPEFKQSPEWLRCAEEQMAEEMSAQVYPDGAQKELTAHYHFVSTRQFGDFTGLLRHAGEPVEPAIATSVENMWNYLAYTIRPSGHIPLNNDSDYLSVRRHVDHAAGRFGRDDWKFIATNGRSGTDPGKTSVVFPWAGHVVMRSGWDAGAYWSFFDVGPWGVTHHHNDKLHLSVAAHGRDLLVDAGRYSYVPGRFRSYFVGSSAHNVILVDGHGQKGTRKEADAPMPGDSYAITNAYDYARGSFQAGFQDVTGEAVHTRAVMFVRGRFWVVVDRIDTDRPRDIDALWHFHPDCTVAVEQGTVASTDPGRGNLRITPVSGLPWRVNVARGMETPDVQGWYSPVYNKKEAAPVAVFSTRIERSQTFAWVLTAASGAVPAVEASFVSIDDGVVRVRVVPQGQQSVTLTIPLAEGAPGLSE
jgi:hypothetical protein